MKISEQILFFLSKDLTEGRNAPSHPRYELGNALSNLTKEFGELSEIIRGKSVLDYGCGAGFQVVALAKLGANRVVGIDTDENALAQGRKLAVENDCIKAVVFKQKTDIYDYQRFDIVISQDAMEHFRRPSESLEDMINVLKPDGRILMIFGPPWYAPYGSHMYFFTIIPWVNILFSEKTVLNVRTHYRDDGAQRYEDVAQGLNKMTVSKFEHIVSNSGLQIVTRRYNVVKGMGILSKIPVIREFFINEIFCVLRRSAS